MADIKQAAKWMQEGKMVRAEHRVYPVYMNEFEIFYQHPSGIRTTICLPDLLADDWEIAND